MPFTDIERPSLALGLLSTTLERADIDSWIDYPCLRYAEQLDPLTYYHLGRLPQESMICDWIFAGAAFGTEIADDDHEFVARSTRPRSVELEEWLRAGQELFEKIFALRKDAQGFVNACAERIVERRPAIVGCTSVFQQHCASLALLRRIKELDQSIATMIGGANCEGPMGIATKRIAPWIDYVVSGEADELIVPLCGELLEAQGAPIERSWVGVIDERQAKEEPRGEGPRATVHKLERLAIPDYHDYFAALEDSPLGPYVQPSLLAEGSRGCWWGAKSHCTFCGLNGNSMAYRTKSPDQLLDELDHLAGTYEIRSFEMVDNILDHRAYRQLLPRLATVEPPLEFFWEIKPNVRRKQVEALAGAGVRHVLPGLESLHDDCLNLLAKGTTTMVNVELLKWAAEFGVRVSWLYLHDIPGEEEAWYDETIGLLPLISHLQPPDHETALQFHRFSPYHRKPEEHGLHLEPAPGYRRVYPAEDDLLTHLAYLFEDKNRRPTLGGVERLTKALDVWRRGFWSPERARLEHEDHGESYVIHDTRPGRAFDAHILGGTDALVYRLCAEATTAQKIVKASDLLSSEVEQSLTELHRRKLLLDASGSLLALSVSRERPVLAGPVGGSFDFDGWDRRAEAVRS